MTSHAVSRPGRLLVPEGPFAQSAVGLIVGLAAAAVTALLSATGSLKALAVLTVVVGTLWFATTRRPTLALAALMVYLGLVDGYLKLASGSTYVTLVRDGLLWALAAGVLVRDIVNQRSLRMPPLGAWVVAFVVVVLVQLGNPADGSLYHSFAGVRQHLEFVPLFFLAFRFVRTRKALRVFAVLLLVIAAANGVASWVQFNESPAQLAAWGPGYASRVLGTGGFEFAGRTFFTAAGQQSTRPFGLGSDAGDGGIVGAFALSSALAMFMLAPRRRRHLVFAAVMGAGAVVAVYTSQGRAVLVASAVIALAFVALVTNVRKRASAAIAVGLGGLVALLVVQALAGSTGSVFRYQGLSGSQLVQTTSAARGRSYAQLPLTLGHYPFGAGLGVAGPATGVSGGGPHAGNVDAENEISFATVELGIPGMLTIVGFTILTLAVGFRRLKGEPDPETRVLLAAVIAPLAGILALYSVSALTPTTPGGPYLWTAGGIVAYWLVARPKQLAAQRTAGVAAAA